MCSTSWKVEVRALPLYHFPFILHFLHTELCVCVVAYNCSNALYGQRFSASSKRRKKRNPPLDCVGRKTPVLRENGTVCPDRGGFADFITHHIDLLGVRMEMRPTFHRTEPVPVSKRNVVSIILCLR